MGQSELLSLLITLSSLIVVVAVLIGLFTAIAKFIAQYGVFIALVGVTYLMFKGNGVDVTWIDSAFNIVGSELLKFSR